VLNYQSYLKNKNRVSVFGPPCSLLTVAGCVDRAGLAMFQKLF